jgi:hypothetical protein
LARQQVPRRLAIEAGTRGWELIEYQELYFSACEYLGESKVEQVTIDRRTHYLPQVIEALEKRSISHYLYDSRTGSEDWRLGLWQSFYVAWSCYIRGITPIATLTDLPVRRWRLQTAIVTSWSGVVISLMSKSRSKRLFPHKRIIGPSIMPFSDKTLSLIENLRLEEASSPKEPIIFLGSLYEPRTSILKRINDCLSVYGLGVHIVGRQLGASKPHSTEYWRSMLRAEILVTTSDQVSGIGMDHLAEPHLIYRYLEATACGTLLVASRVVGLGRYLEDGREYIGFSSAEEAAEKILFYARHQAERQMIAEAGRKKAEQLIRSKVYWILVDASLGAHALKEE